MLMQHNIDPQPWGIVWQIFWQSDAGEGFAGISSVYAKSFFVSSGLHATFNRQIGGQIVWRSDAKGGCAGIECARYLLAEDVKSDSCGPSASFDRRFVWQSDAQVRHVECVR